MSDVDLQALTDAGTFVSLEHQAHLAGEVGIGEPEVDPAAGLLRFTDRTGARRAVRAHFVGTSSPADGTWLWSWENINGFPEAFSRTSGRVRALGERYGIAELTTASLPAGDRTPGELLAAVEAITGTTAHAAVPTGNGGTVAWLLLDDPALALPPPTAARAVAVITSALADGRARDHRRALRAWAEQRGAAFAEIDDEVVRLGLTDGDLQVRFDADSRIAGVGRRLRPVPQPGPSPAPAAAPSRATPTAAIPTAEPVEDDPAGALLAAATAAGGTDEQVGPDEPRTWRDRLRGLFT